MKILRTVLDWYFSKQALPYWVVLVFDCTVVLLCNLLVYALRSGRGVHLVTSWQLILTLVCYLVPYMIGFRLMKTYRGVLRYSSFSDLIRIGAANFIGILLIWIARKFFHADMFLEPIGIIGLMFAWLLSTMIMFGVRIIVKHMYDSISTKEKAQRVFIYGTKAGGIALAKSIRVERPARYVLCGFISDSKDMPGHMLMGVKVYPNDEHLIEKMKKMQAAMEKGFKLATKSWGKDKLPGICGETFDAANRLFEEYYKSKESEALSAE